MLHACIRYSWPTSQFDSGRVGPDMQWRRIRHTPANAIALAQDMWLESFVLPSLILSQGRGFNQSVANIAQIPSKIFIVRFDMSAPFLAHHRDDMVKA